jgi:hypothetical protein
MCYYSLAFDPSIWANHSHQRSIILRTHLSGM